MYRSIFATFRPVAGVVIWLIGAQAPVSGAPPAWPGATTVDAGESIIEASAAGTGHERPLTEQDAVRLALYAGDGTTPMGEPTWGVALGVSLLFSLLMLGWSWWLVNRPRTGDLS